MEKKKTLIGIGVCGIVTVLFLMMFILFNCRTSKIDISEIQVLKESEQNSVKIEQVEFLNHGVFRVNVIAEPEGIAYDYHNWVLGDGTGLYKNYTVLLVEQNHQNAYKLKTYCQDSGMIGLGKTSLLEKNNLEIAVMFQTREGEYYILYPKESYYVQK